MDGGGDNGSWPLSSFALGTMGLGRAVPRPSVRSIGGVLLGSSSRNAMDFFGSLIARWPSTVDSSASPSLGSAADMVGWGELANFLGCRDVGSFDVVTSCIEDGRPLFI